MASDKELGRRLARVQAALKRRKLDAMIVFDRFNTYYTTGFPSSLSYFIVTRSEALLLVDARYIEAARANVTHCEVGLFKDIGKSLAAWSKRARPRRIGLEGSIPWAMWERFDAMIPGVEWVESGGAIGDLRLKKSSDEIRKIAASARMNDAVYEAALKAAQPGATEIDLRNAIRGEADRRGAAGESFECIVATGTAGSMPHYVPHDRALRSGDMLLIDLGMLVDGYCSDMTRVVALGKKPRARMRRAFDAVLEAEEAALAAVGPGVACADLHAIAVDRLKRRGLAKYFTHGLGHGVGLEIHEAPTLNAVSKDVLESGMVITIEPGVYLSGLGGVRIEDLVVVTRTGHRVLSRAPKSYRTLPFA